MAALLGTCGAAAANDGSLDIGFGFLGSVELSPAGMNAQTTWQMQTRIDNQGRIVGCIRTLNGANKPVPWLFRLTATGATDATFAGTGSKFLAIPAGATGGLGCDGFALAADGRIVLASYDGANQYIMRMKTDGTPDTTFNGSGTLVIPRTGSSNDFTYDATVGSDGSVYIAYARYTANGSRMVVRHVLENGTVDAAFGPGGGGATVFDGFAIRTGVTARDDDPTRILLTSTGQIIVTGTTEPTAGSADFAAARLDSSGNPDPTFGTAGARIVAFDNGQANADRCYSSTLDAHGRLVMVGYSQRSTAGDYDFAVVRLLGTGAPDSAFSGDGKLQIAFDLNGAGEDVGASVALQSDGRIVVGGYAKHVTGSSGADWAVARVLDNGALDATFGAASNGKQTYGVNLGGDNGDYVEHLVADGGDFILAGTASTGATTQSAVFGRIRPDLIFTNAFGD